MWFQIITLWLLYILLAVYHDLDCMFRSVESLIVYCRLSVYMYTNSIKIVWLTVLIIWLGPLSHSDCLDGLLMCLHVHFGGFGICLVASTFCLDWLGILLWCLIVFTFGCDIDISIFYVATIGNTIKIVNNVRLSPNTTISVVLSLCGTMIKLHYSRRKWGEGGRKDH